MKLKDFINLIDDEDIVLELWISLMWLFDCHKDCHALEPYYSWRVECFVPKIVEINGECEVRLVVSILNDNI